MSVAGGFFSSSFSHIDATSNPTEFVQYMDDANSMDFFRAAKRRTYDLLALRPGERVLDVGCGARTLYPWRGLGRLAYGGPRPAARRPDARPT